MNRTPSACAQPVNVELKHLVESLAHCICATDEPHATLTALVAQLHREVQVTHRVANQHLHRRQAAQA